MHFGTQLAAFSVTVLSPSSGLNMETESLLEMSVPNYTLSHTWRGQILFYHQIAWQVLDFIHCGLRGFTFCHSKWFIPV